jgi:hypothetical protein
MPIPGVVWIYNSNTGAIVALPLPTATIELKSGLGWHGPFSSEQAAKSYYAEHAAANPGWKAPTNWQGAVGNLAGDVQSGVKNITDPFKNLNLGAWFIRIGEIALGIVLIGVGVAKLTGASNAISKVAKVVIPG